MAPCLFLMTRPPPRSTLVPYTTLFRSLYQHLLRRALRGEAPEDDWTPELNIGLTGLIPLDRKSTRLNSSHANISYAVFCLKKKNIFSSNAGFIFALLLISSSCFGFRRT